MNRAMTITFTRMIIISQHDKTYNTDIVGELSRMRGTGI